ncbi:MAG TPA: hypothetical protein VGD91_09445 [Trebonia sp.]
MSCLSKATLLLLAGAFLAAGCAFASPVSPASSAVKPSVPTAASSAPSGSPSMGLNSANQADAVGYWRASGTATALLAWEKAHIWRGFSRQDVLLGPPSWNTVYSLPAVPGVLPVREMNVQFYQSGGGMTVIMADAMVSWQPPRPAAAVIPSSVTEVSIAADGPWYGSPAPVTITSVRVVRQLAALVNQLPLSTVRKDVPCPSGPAGFTLTFRGVAGAPAVAFLGPGACGSASFRLGGREQPPLQPSAAFLTAVLETAMLSWKPVV